MSIATELTERERLAQEALDTHGWTRGTLKDGEGAYCLHGAVMYCAPVNGDAQIVSQVLNHRGFTYAWNDTDAADAAEVRAALDRDITDEELAEVFGPQWEHIVALVRRASELTEDEVKALRDAWAAAPGVAWLTAWDTAQEAVQATWSAAQADVWATTENAAPGAAWFVTRAAYQAVAARDLIGQHGFTQEHYDALTGPWRKAVGPVHPDDKD